MLSSDFGFAFGLGAGLGTSTRGAAVATDVAGNVYLTGNFQRTIDFDPGPGTFNLTAIPNWSPLGDDVFVAKYSSTGALVWVKHLASPFPHTVFGAAVDGNGNVYTTGVYVGPIDFDPGPGTFYLGGAPGGPPNTFVWKLDSAGNFVWASGMITNGQGFISSTGIAVDGSGNVFTTGTFSGTVDFDPGPGTFNRTSLNYDGDVFVSKLDPAGNFAWAGQIGGRDYEYSSAITVDRSGNAYIAGHFRDTVDVDPGPGTYYLTTRPLGNEDVFVVKLDGAGRFVWARQLVGNSTANSSATSITVDNSGTVYATGSFYGTIDFDPGPGTYVLGANGTGPNPFVWKLDSAGSFIWARTVPGGYVLPYDIALDNSGSVYTSGVFHGTVDFDPGPGSFTLTTGRSSNAFVWKLTSAGEFVWARQMAGDTSVGSSIALDSSRNIYTTGLFIGTVDFDPSSGVFPLTSTVTFPLGGSDLFLSKLVDGNTSTVLTSSQNPSVVGQSVTFTAMVSPVVPGGGTPTGTVTFDGTTCGAVPVVNRQARCAVATLPVGGHTITARYNGDTNFNRSSASLTQTVNRASSATVLTTSVNPSVYGQSVTFTATVSVVAPGAGTPTGTVSFAGTACGPVALNNRQASCTVANLPVGSQTITATYSGDANFNASSHSLTQTVNRANSATVLVTSVNPAVYGQSIPFTATVRPATPGASVATGSVTFLLNGTPLTTVALNAAGQAGWAPTLAVGSHTLTATYNGDARLAPSTSPPLVQQVRRAATATVLVTFVNPSVYGQPVTFTASVSAVAPGAGTPTGTVTFGGTACGPVALNNRQASCTVANLPVGNQPITATYSGDANFNASSHSLTQTVNRANSSTVLVTSVNPSVYGQSVTFTATVSTVAPGAGTPTGTVTFGGTACAPVSLTNRQASCTVANLPVGSHTITATYSGNANFNASAHSFTQTVNRAGTTLVLTTSGSPSVFGQGVTFTATVNPVAPGAGQPSGAVTFRAGSTVLGTMSLNGSRQASLTVGTLPVASHAITATYAGDGSFGPSSTSLTQMVNRAGTSTALVTSANPVVFGQSITFTATIAVLAPGAGALSGAVTFQAGSTLLGTVLLNPSRQASLTVASLPAGSSIITATYGGDASFAASAGRLTQTVTPASTTTTVASSVNPAVAGVTVVFTATVRAVAPGAGTPAGVVAFQAGALALGTAGLDASGLARLAVNTLTPGSYTITATYQGNGSFTASTSPPLTQQITSPPSCPVSLTGGLLEVRCDSRADRLRLDFPGNLVQLVANGQTTTVPQSQVNAVRLDLGGGDNQLTILATVAGKPVNVVGGAGPDALLLDYGSGIVTAATYTVTDTFLERTGGARISHTGLESLRLLAGPSEDTFQFLSPAITAAVTIEGGAGADTVVVTTGPVAPELVHVETLRLEGGAAFVSPAGRDVRIPNLIFNSGTFAGSGTLTVTASATWTGGTMSGVGRTTLAGGLNIQGPAPKTLNRNLDAVGLITVNGTLTWLGGTISGTRTLITAGGHVSVQGSVTLSGLLTNQGTVQVQSDTLNLTSSGSSSGNITGPGAVQFNGAVYNVGGIYNVGATVVNGGRAQFDAAASLGTLRVIGTALPDTLVLRDRAGNPNFFEIMVNGQLRCEAPWTGPTSLTLDGLAGNDILTVERSQPGVPLTVQGGDGNDTFHVGRESSALSQLQGPLTVQGGSGTDTLNLNDQSSPGGHDYFVSATDVTRSGVPGPINYGGLEGLTLQGAVAGNNAYWITGTAVGMQAAIAGGRGDYLARTTGASTWAITATDAGTLTGVGMGAALAFTGCANLIGSPEDDTFVFGDGVGLTGSIDGGTGLNTLDYSAWTTGVYADLYDALVQVYVQGNLVVFFVFNIQNVLGGAGPDYLHGDGNHNLLVGNGGDDILVGDEGNDTLRGGDGRDMLFGGGGADRLEGGAGEDLLIDGYTSYDYDVFCLSDLWYEWTRTDVDYYGRIDNLRNGTGLSSCVLDATTVWSDGDVDELLGGDDLDWFWAGEGDLLVDRLDPDEVVN